MTIIYNEEFTSSDFIISSLLYSLNQELMNSRREGLKVDFVFDNKEKCDELISKYYQGKLLIDPKKFVDAQKTIKQIIFNKTK